MTRVTPAFVAFATCLTLVSCANPGRPGSLTRVATTAITDRTVDISRLPASAEEFLALRDQVATSPEGGAAMFCVALILYAKDEALGRECLTIAVDNGRLSSGPKGYKGLQVGNGDLQLIEGQLKQAPHIGSSYVKGTDPDSGYALPAMPWEIKLTGEDRDVGQGAVKVFVYSTGADSARPITLKQNDKGFWKADEWSSLVVGVRKPAGAPAADPF